MTGVMTVNLADLIDENPVLSATSFTASIAETVSIGTSITLSPSFSVSDADAGDIATYSLTGMFCNSDFSAILSSKLVET